MISVTQFCQHVPDCSIRKDKQDVRVEQSLKLQNLVNINTWLHSTLLWCSPDHFEASVHANLYLAKHNIAKNAVYNLEPLQEAVKCFPVKGTNANVKFFIKWLVYNTATLI